MAKIIFDDDLANKINSKYHIRNSKQPFSSWIVKPFTFKRNKYYLYIEQTTNLAIIARFLDLDKFNEVLHHTLLELPFTTSIQVNKVSSILNNLTYSYEKDVPDLSTEKYQKSLANIPNSEFEEMQEACKNNEIFEAALLSVYLNQTTDTDDGVSISTQFVLELNKVFPIPSQKPKKNVKYVNLEANFADPRSWDKFEEITPDSVPAKQLQKNNLKIIEQFEHSTYSKQLYKTNHVFSALEAFLNGFLFKHGVRPVTANLADPIIFIEVNTMMDEMVSQDVVASLYDIFDSFYNFLSHTGIIRKADAEKVIGLLNESYRNYIEEDLDADNIPEPDPDFTKAIMEVIEEKDPESLAQFLMNGTDALTDKDLDKIVQVYQKNKYQLPEPELENKERNNQTYEIRAKLRGFKPSTWRRFQISGSASVATLQKAIITMFNGEFGHMYDLFDNKTQEVYELPEFHDEDFGHPTIDATKAKVSSFNLNQKLTLTYDFGDNWEFEITIKKILDEKPPKHPTILSGKGYGIIEDIGGVWGLIDYYNDNLDPEEREWIGDIDLDEFDIDEMNEELKGFE